jgi:tetratricopeptide (TPR) repeat protein
LLIAKGDSLFGIKDYADALSSYTKASGIKPAESYPKQRIIETNKIIEGTKQASTSEYKDAIAAADKLYSNKVYDKAIDAYESASKINPGDSYPEVQISKIRKYLSDHAILNLYSQALLISRGNEKKFTFATIDPSLRKNNYILLNARSIGSGVPKVYLNYGKDDQKNGGIVIRNLDKTKTLSDFLISISIQDKWFREENNWISISVETGEIEITKVQISAGD